MPSCATAHRGSRRRSLLDTQDSCSRLHVRSVYRMLTAELILERGPVRGVHSTTLKTGLGVSLRQVSRDRHHVLKDALDQALSGVPIYRILDDRQQYDYIGAGPGDVLALLFNISLTRVRTQRRQLIVISPRQI